MREIVYQFNSRGTYETADSTLFGGEDQLRLVATPHAFSLAIGNEVLRDTSFGGCAVTVSRDGEVIFCDTDGNELGRAEKGDCTYQHARLAWKQDRLSVLFGCYETVDHYPDCDGEHDRWSTRWVTEREGTLKLCDGTVSVG